MKPSVQDIECYRRYRNGLAEYCQSAISLTTPSKEVRIFCLVMLENAVGSLLAIKVPKDVLLMMFVSLIAELENLGLSKMVDSAVAQHLQDIQDRVLNEQRKTS